MSEQDEKPPVSRYLITSSAKAPRIVYNARRKPVTINPGQAVEIDMDAVTAGRIVTFDSGLEVTQRGAHLTEHAAASPSRSSQTGGSGSASTGGQGGQGSGDGTNRTPNDLIKVLDDRSELYQNVMAEAKVLIGEDKWPGGVPKKSDLKKLLKEHPDYVEE